MISKRAICACLEIMVGSPPRLADASICYNAPTLNILFFVLAWFSVETARGDAAPNHLDTGLPGRCDSCADAVGIEYLRVALPARSLLRHHHPGAARWPRRGAPDAATRHVSAAAAGADLARPDDLPGGRADPFIEAAARAAPTNPDHL